MNHLAIIPARGGSKRIPGKNIRPFDGKPIIEYSISAALQSGLFSEVMVSTDDRQIAEIAEQSGASVPFLRSEKNSGDFSSTVDVLTEVINTYKALGNNFELACCIYPTAPFVSGEILNRGLTLLSEKNFNTVFPVVPFDYPIQRSLEIDGSGKVKMVWPEHLSSRSQDLKPRFHDAGMFYWFKTALIRSGLFSSNSGCIVLDPVACHDIDTEADWALAELKYKRLSSQDNL